MAAKGGYHGSGWCRDASRASSWGPTDRTEWGGRGRRSGRGQIVGGDPALDLEHVRSVPGKAGLTGIPAWPGTGRAQDEEEDEEDVGQDGYDDEDDEEEEASVDAGGGDRGDRPPPPEGAGPLTSCGSADRQAWCRTGMTWNDKQSLLRGRGRDRALTLSNPLPLTLAVTLDGHLE